MTKRLDNFQAPVLAAFLRRLHRSSDLLHTKSHETIVEVASSYLEISFRLLQKIDNGTSRIQASAFESAMIGPRGTGDNGNHLATAVLQGSRGTPLL
jgi:hypothetical protein